MSYKQAPRQAPVLVSLAPNHWRGQPSVSFWPQLPVLKVLQEPGAVSSGRGTMAAASRKPAIVERQEVRGGGLEQGGSERVSLEGTGLVSGQEATGRQAAA